MRNNGSIGNCVAIDDQSDLEKQEKAESGDHTSLAEVDSAANDCDQTVLTIVVSNEGSPNPLNIASELVEKFPRTVELTKEENDAHEVSPKKELLSRDASCHEQCRVCQQEKEEDLIDLGCQCRGGLAKAHQSCINTWFHTRGSNKCEICQHVAANVPPPELQPSTSYWIWRVDPAFRGATMAQERETGCFRPLWVAFSILIGALLLDVLISITLGVSALPVNIIIGVIVVLGLGTALRLALEFCHAWSIRRVVQRVETNVNLGYHPAL